MKENTKTASELHKNVPPDWYYRSIKENVFQRYWHKRRFEEVSKLIDPVVGIVLDVGSADGMFTKVILDKSKAKKVVGIDVLKSSVDWANKHWKKNKRLEFKVSDAHSLAFESNIFSAVFALEVLEHVHKPKEVIGQIKRVLKKDGYAVFLVPTDSLLFRLIWFFWTKFRGKIWDDTHIQSYTNSSLLDMCISVGFEVEVSKKFLLGMLHVVKVRKK